MKYTDVQRLCVNTVTVLYEELEHFDILMADEDNPHKHQGTTLLPASLPLVFFKQNIY